MQRTVAFRPSKRLVRLTFKRDCEQKITKKTLRDKHGRTTGLYIFFLLIETTIASTKYFSTCKKDLLKSAFINEFTNFNTPTNQYKLETP